MSFRDDVIGAVQTAACQYVSGVGNANSWLQRLVPTAPDPPFIGGIKGLLCDDPTPPPSPPPQFSGGQCDFIYRVYYGRSNSQNEFLCCGTSISYRGPIGPMTSRPDPDGSDRTQWGFTYEGGAEFRSVAKVSSDTTFFITRVEPASPSDVDDCGDSQPIPPPFEPPTITVPIPDPVDPSAPDIDVDVTLYAPIVVGPNVFAPVTVNGPNFDIDGRITLAPDFNIEVGLGGGGGSGGGGGGGTSVPDEPGDVNPDDPSEPEGADGRFLLGIHVSLSFADTARFTELAQDGSIELIGVPRVATVYFVANMGGARSRLPGIELQLRRTFVPVPPGVVAVSWNIHTEDGATIQSVRPVYGTSLPGQDGSGNT